MKNLDDLNATLFETLEQVKNGQMETDKAKTIVGISNTIIQNGKLQLEAIKFTKKQSLPGLLLSGGGEKSKDGVEVVMPFNEKMKLYKKDKHAAMTMFAKHLDYKNVAEAISDLKKPEFEKQFEAWLETDK